MKKEFHLTQKEAQLVVDAISGWEECIGTYDEPDCPLCDMFAAQVEKEEDECLLCPVYKYTGKYGCRGTPFYTLPSDTLPQRMVKFGKKMLNAAGYEIKEILE